VPGLEGDLLPGVELSLFKASLAGVVVGQDAQGAQGMLVAGLLLEKEPFIKAGAVG